MYALGCVPRLLGVIMDDSRLHLIFEFLDKDLKKYMETLEPDELMSPELVKVPNSDHSVSYSLMNQLFFWEKIWINGL